MSYVIIDIQGFELSNEEVPLIMNGNCAGVILFTRNFKSIAQLKTLVMTLRAIRSDLLITVDHEGGKVQRFREGFTALPTAKTYGNLYHENKSQALQFAFENGYIMAKELLEIGIDLSFAPVLDREGPSEVIAKYHRAIDSDPNVIVEVSRAFIQGMNKAGMQAVGKHFPGHGSCQLDSHVTKPIDDRAKEDVLIDRRPFDVLIQEGTLKALMPAHVCYPSIDKDNIVTYSGIWLEDILRKEMAFNGVIISDCISMQGSDIGDYSVRLKTALKHCDIAILSHMASVQVVASLLNGLHMTKDLRVQQSKVAALRGVLPQSFKEELKIFVDNFSVDKFVKQNAKENQLNSDLADNLFS